MKKFTFQEKSKKMLSTRIRGQIMPTRNKPQKSISASRPLSIKQTRKINEYLLSHNFPAGEKNSLEQAAFWHEVKVLSCLLIPFLLTAYARYFNWNSSDFPHPVGKTVNMFFL